jgi:hypothetical protein
MTQDDFRIQQEEQGGLMIHELSEKARRSTPSA